MRILFLLFCFVCSLYSQPFVLFTEPKTGTHLLIPILESLTGKKVFWAKQFQNNSGIATNLDLNNPNLIYFSFQKAPWDLPLMEKIWNINEKKGAFLHLHAPYSLVFENYLLKKNCISFFIKRDPRDRIISLLNHYRHIKLNDKNLQSISSDDELLLLLIRNKLRVSTLAFMGWLHSPVSCVLDFAKLMGAHGGAATDSDALSEIKKIASALQLDHSDEDLEKIYRASFGHGWSFFRGKVGTWKEVFQEEHKVAVKEEIGDLLIELGYENNLDW
ncbi:MAG TPA: sulfotransferase domain-containing protein [Chlamydiales bacterium]|jgi:hypothetical protein|nr:sulfotransferase domain-containing protein [Chlamydiales bacterium]